MQPSVELVGLQQIVEYIDNCLTAGYQYYIVYQGAKNVKFQYSGEDIEGEGIDALTLALSVPAKNGTSAIYTLAFFSKLKADGEIDKTTQIASVNFRLNEPNAMFNRSNDYSQHNDIKKEIELLHDKIEQLASVGEAEEIEPAISPFMQIITGLLSNPAIQERIVTKAMGFIDQILPDKKTIAGITLDEINISDKQRIDNAISVLLEFDKEFINNIELLAQLAKQKTLVYNMAVAQLKTFK